MTMESNMKKVSIFNRNQIIASLLAMTLLTTAGCGGISSKRWKQIGTVVAIGIAAKLIYDMVVDYNRSKLMMKVKLLIATRNNMENYRKAPY